MSRTLRVPALVTTSWDDGDPLDVRLAELLAKYGLRGTFYVPSGGAEAGWLRVLRRLGMEVGSHTVSHAVLTKLRENEARLELAGSKRRLEDLLGEPVTSFCYPTGAFSRRLAKLVREAGYRVGRTTVAFHTGLRFDAARMPVSYQFFPHPSQIHIRHALKEANGAGLANWLWKWKRESGLLKLNALMLAEVARSGGVLHLWGHSWEIDKHGLWGVLEDALKAIAGAEGIEACTNAEVAERALPD